MLLLMLPSQGPGFHSSWALERILVIWNTTNTDINSQTVIASDVTLMNATP